MQGLVGEKHCQQLSSLLVMSMLKQAQGTAQNVHPVPCSKKILFHLCCSSRQHHFALSWKSSSNSSGCWTFPCKSLRTQKINPQESNTTRNETNNNTVKWTVLNGTVKWTPSRWGKKLIVFPSYWTTVLIVLSIVILTTTLSLKCLIFQVPLSTDSIVLLKTQMKKWKKI